MKIPSRNYGKAKIEDLWSTTDMFGDPSGCELQRIEDEERTYWQLSMMEFPPDRRNTCVDVDRKQLKDLHDAIEHELYPERYIPAKTDREANVRTVVDLLGTLGFTDEERNHFILRAKSLKAKED